MTLKAQQFFSNATVVLPSTLINGTVVVVCYGGKGTTGFWSGDGVNQGGIGGNGAVVGATVPASPTQQFTASFGGNGVGGGGGGLGAGGSGGWGGSYAAASVAGSVQVIAGGGGGGGGGGKHYTRTGITGGNGGSSSVPGGTATGGTQGSFIGSAAGGAGAGASAGTGGLGGGGGTSNDGTPSGSGTAGGNGSLATGGAGGLGNLEGGGGGGAGGGGYGGGGAGGAGGDVHSGDGTVAAGGGGGGGGASWVATGVVVTGGSGNGNAGAATVVLEYRVADAPTAPTLLGPSNSTTINTHDNATAFQFTYNPATSGDSGLINAYALRLKLAGGSYKYWNGTNFTSTTIQWNACTSGTSVVNIPAGKIATNAVPYTWSIATQEASHNLQGPFANDFSFTSAAKPTAVLTSPVGPSHPYALRASWTATFSSGTSQIAYEVIAFRKATTEQPGFVPNLAGTNVMAFSTTSATTSVNLSMFAPTFAGADTYVMYLRVTATGTIQSNWVSSTFTISYDPPAVPTAFALATTTATTGLPVNRITVQEHDNLIDAGTSSFEGTLGTLTGFGNCSGTPVTGFNADGLYSAQITCTTAGTMTAHTATAPSGVPVMAGEMLAFWSLFGAKTTSRTCTLQAIYRRSTGSTLSTVNVTTARDIGAGTPIFGTATVPTNAAYCDIGVSIAGAAKGEIHYLDELGIFVGALSYDNQVKSLNPTGYYRLADAKGSTTIVDIGSQLHVGTLHGGVTLGQPGPFPTIPGDTAALLDGTSGYITTTEALNSDTAAAVMAWFRATSLPTTTPQIAGFSTGSGGISIALSPTGTISTFVSNGITSSIATGLSLPGGAVGNWHHVALVWTGSHVFVYIDGAQASTAVLSGGSLGSHTIGIGSATGSTGFFHGSIAQVAAFGNTLSASQVATIYAAAKAATPGITGWTIGGYVGHSTATVEFSDDTGVSWTTVRNGSVTLGTDQQGIVTDYEAPFGIPRLYRANVVGQLVTQSKSAWSAVVSSTIPQQTRWWVLDPTKPTTAQGLNRVGVSSSTAGGSSLNSVPISIEINQPEQQGLFRPFGRSLPILVRGDMYAEEFTIGLLFLTAPSWTRFNELRASRVTVLLRSDMAGQSYYVAFGPTRPVDTVRDTQRTQVPIRQLIVQCIPQERP